MNEKKTPAEITSAAKSKQEQEAEAVEAEIIHARLAARTPKRIDPGGRRPAAVLIPLFHKEGEWWILLTRRTNTVEHHKGEISFPGGQRDPEDADDAAAALRETAEELGIPPAEIILLGQLDDSITYTGFRISPFVGLLPSSFTLRPNPTEIAEIISLPLAAFLKPDRFRQNILPSPDGPYPVYYFETRGYVVWGATAKILKAFLELIFNAKYD